MKPHQQQATSSLSHSTMKSLALPEELYWDGKSEPISPECNELFVIATDLVETENWLYDDNFANEILLNLELKSGDEIMHDLTEGDELVVEFFDFKEENWPPHAAGVVTQIPSYTESDNVPTTPPIVQTKLSPLSFDPYYGENIVETGSLSSLTPPQSPPCNEIFSIIPQQPNTTPVQFHTLHYHPATVPVSPAPTASAYVNVIPNAAAELHPLSIGSTQFGNNANVEVKNEIEQAKLVDQIIEELAKNLPDMSDEYGSQYTYSPPSQIEETTTDEEWTPTESSNSSPSRYSSRSSSCSGDDVYQNEADQTNAAPTTKKRRPYGRGVEDRKIRKKEQNKNAATRYRQKKKLEMEIVLDEEQKLTLRNEELQGQFTKCVREMKYLKSLIREFYSKESQKSA